MWQAPTTTIQERQQIVRYLVERITVTIRGESQWADVTIRWAGGIESQHEIRRPVRKYDQLTNYDALLDRMVELRRTGATTEAIADQLNRDGFHPPRGSRQFNRHIVNLFMARRGLLGPRGTRRIAPEDIGLHEWRLRDLTRVLSMPATSLRRWYHRGWVQGRYTAGDMGCLILWADEAELARLRRLRNWPHGGCHRERPLDVTTPLSQRPSFTKELSQPTGRSSGQSARQ